MKTSFERVTFEDAGRRRTVILRDVIFSAPLVADGSPTVLRGIEVVNHRDGCGWHDAEPAGADQRLRIIDVGLITRRTPMHEDPTYGGLVVDNWAVVIGSPAPGLHPEPRLDNPGALFLDLENPEDRFPFFHGASEAEA